MCPTLCDPVDCSLRGSSIHRILQARILEWVAISFSRESSQPRNRTQVSHIAGRCFTLPREGKPQGNQASHQGNPKRGVMPSYPEASLLGSTLAERCSHTLGRTWRYTKYGLRTRQIKMIGQRQTQKKCPMKVI